MTTQGQSQKKYKDRRQAPHYNFNKLWIAYLESGLSGFKELAERIKKEFGEEGVKYREMIYILRGERAWPRPSWVSQIAFVLNIPISNIIEENAEKK